MEPSIYYHHGVKAIGREGVVDEDFKPSGACSGSDDAVLRTGHCRDGRAVAAQIGGNSTPTINTNQYLSLISRRANNLNALAQLLENAQYTYLPMVPPAADFSFDAQGWLTPFNFTNLPAGFDLEHLAAVQRHGVMVYPLTIAQDPANHDTVFLNSQGDVLYTMPPPAGYDPVAWLMNWRPNLVTSLATAASTNAWLSLYDPAKVQLSVQLIAMEDVVPYLLDVAIAQQETQQQANAMMAMTPGGMNPPTFPTPEHLCIQALNVDANGANLIIGYPAGFTNHMYIFSCSDLLATNWWALGSDLAPTTNWTDATVTTSMMNASMRFTMDTPGFPGDSTNTWTNTAPTSSEARFYKAVDATMDSNGDGIPDWWEVTYFGGLTNAVADADANSNGVDNLSEYLLGHNPREVVAPDPNAVLALQVYTPLYNPPQ